MTRLSLAAALAAASALLLVPSAASAEPTYIYTCNSDGYIHMDVTTDTGMQIHFKTHIRCGPDLLVANGDVVRLVIGARNDVPAAGQGFLTHVEKSGLGVLARVRAPKPPATAPGRATTIYLSPDRVGPNLARLLTSADPAWRQPSAGPARTR